MHASYVKGKSFEDKMFPTYFSPWDSWMMFCQHGILVRLRLNLVITLHWFVCLTVLMVTTCTSVCPEKTIRACLETVSHFQRV